MTRLATDAGGTFTDLVGLDEATGKIFVGKALTTPRDPSEGVLATIRQVEENGFVASATKFFVHGGTIVINAITERKGAATALVTTRGFRDVIAVGRGNRPDLYNLQADLPAPFVPRHLCFEVTERMDARGRVRVPLSEADLETVAAAIAQAAIRAVAVVFIHAYVNPEHERRAADFLRIRLPGTAVTASHEVSRQWREYERADTAVLSAYVQPIITHYLGNLDGALAREGFDCPFYAMQSSGGLSGFAAARSEPLTLVESGPAGGVAGAMRVGEALGETEVLYLDIGGTTAKCSLITGGRPVLRPEYKLERTRLHPGYPMQVPVVDIVEIGAGGGSIVWIEEGGAVRVGPISAGADPGPACYSRGGTDPTVTDAKLITGVLDPERFAGGRIRLDVARARQALQPVAAHLGGSVEDAADAVIRLVEANMINALKLVTVQRGHDPRDVVMVASGGGGPMHAGMLGRELEVRMVVIPRYAGLFSAWGMLAALPRVDISRTCLTPAEGGAIAVARSVFGELQAAALARVGAASTGQARFTRTIEMRYAGQEHTVATPFDAGTSSLDWLLEVFHAAHEKAYTFSLPETPAELVTFHLTAELDAPRVTLPLLEERTTLDSARRGERPVYFGAEEGYLPTAVFDRGNLPGGAVIEGPGLIDEDTSTTLVLPGQRLTVEPRGLLLIEEAS